MVGDPAASTAGSWAGGSSPPRCSPAAVQSSAIPPNGSECRRDLRARRRGHRRATEDLGCCPASRRTRACERVLVALTGDAEEGAAPRADDLFAYAELLGEKADELAARDPLPGVTEIRQALREVDTAEHATRLSDTDLVLLAAAASGKTAATPRLELYPRDLSPVRALKISQAGS